MRLSLFSICLIVLCSLLHQSALAAAEFCPATLTIRAVGGSQTAPAPADLYEIDLSAMGPRSVTANLAFDTDTGWYTLDLPATTITAKDRHYSGPSASFVEHDWVSAPFYVRFPESVHIRRAWVMSALSTGDTFGWSGQGLTGCLPPAGDIAQPDVHGKVGPFSIDPKDRDHLGVPPPADAHILVPKPSTPLEQSTCAQP